MIKSYNLMSPKAQNITSILASIACRNERITVFHEKNGFRECGGFEKTGKKNGQVLDVVWLQKML